MASTYRVGFIGGGKLANSVMRGLVRAKFCSPGQILVSEPVDSARAGLRDELGVTVTAENREVAGNAEIVFLAVKPGIVLAALEGIHGSLANKLVVSLAAGVGLAEMETKATARFMRAMTNTPSAVCQAATALAAGSRTLPEDIARVKELFQAIGKVVEVAAEKIDAVTALAGSGPAFVYTVIEALARGGEACGLPHDISLELATQTVRGAAELALESKLSPEELRRMVITPGGTTAAGLAAMEKAQTVTGLRAAVEAAAARAKELAPKS